MCFSKCYAIADNLKTVFKMHRGWSSAGQLQTCVMMVSRVVQFLISYTGWHSIAGNLSGVQAWLGKQANKGSDNYWGMLNISIFKHHTIANISRFLHESFTKENRLVRIMLCHMNFFLYMRKKQLLHSFGSGIVHNL